MLKTEFMFGGSVFEISRVEGDNQVSRLLGNIHSEGNCIIPEERSSAFSECVRMCSVVSTVMNWDITVAVLGIQIL